MKILLAVLTAMVVVAASASAADTASPFCVPRSAPIAQGTPSLVSDRVVDGTGGRLHTLVLDSPALHARTAVNVLLPAGYDPTRRYPVLYLLHGALSNYGQWQNEGGVMGVIDGVKDLPPFITVMPDGGAWGFYSDWYGSDLDGHTPDPPPAWARYHVGELIPWIDAHFPTIADRSGRAIAGLSMGGFGAMSYAARYPDRFAAAGSFSGVVNPDLDYAYGNAFITLASVYFDQGHVDQCVWGDAVTQRVRWQGHDPTSLASNLTATSLFVASGGVDVGHPALADPVEETCYLMSRAFTRALDAAGVAHSDFFYGTGTHLDFEYWREDLRRFLPHVAAAWQHPPPAPRAFAYRSIAPVFSVWGWDFTTHREATEFTYLDHVGRRGLHAIGSGRLDVTTAPLYRPGRAYRVGRDTVRAGADGRLRFTVDLGPAHTHQQTRFGRRATRAWRQARVAIR